MKSAFSRAISGTPSMRTACPHPHCTRASRRYYVTNATAFVVGFSWIVLLRDLANLFSQALTSGVVQYHSWIDFKSEGAIVAIFGPVLTLVLIGTKKSSFSTLLCSQRAIDRLLLRDLPPPVAAEAGGEVDADLGRRVAARRDEMRRHIHGRSHSARAPNSERTDRLMYGRSLSASAPNSERSARRSAYCDPSAAGIPLSSR